MAFIKRNLFYIILIATVVLVTGGVWAMLIGPNNAGAEEKKAERIKLYKSLNNLRSRGANAEMVATQQQIVESLKKQRETLVKAAAEMNQKARKPLVITLADTNETFPAFPVDRANYETHTLDALFAKVYRDAMDALLAELHGAEGLTAAEIQAGVTKQTRFLAEKARKEMAEADDSQSTVILPTGVPQPIDPTAATAAPKANFGRPATGGIYGGGGGVYGNAGGMMPPGGGVYGNGGMEGPGMPPHMMPPRPGMAAPMAAATMDNRKAKALASVDSAEAERQAINNLMVLKVQRNPVYANSSSFDYHPLPEGRRADLAEMWKANVNYWLHRHIVDAIQAANERSPRPSGAPVTIANAIVKRLVGAKISKTVSTTNMDAVTTVLYKGESETAASSTAGPAMGPGAAPGLNFMPGGGFGDSAIYGGGGGASVAGDTAGTLTERECNPVYDVINFEITVVLSAAHMQVFFDHLTFGDFYTIQKIDLIDAYSERPAANATTAGPRTDTAFYYGADPVLKAVIKVEALLFCEWERDLMPVEMLKRLPATALRPEDHTRMAAGGAPGATPATPPPPQFNMY